MKYLLEHNEYVEQSFLNEAIINESLKDVYDHLKVAYKIGIRDRGSLMILIKFILHKKMKASKLKKFFATKKDDPKFKKVLKDIGHLELGKAIDDLLGKTKTEKQQHIVFKAILTYLIVMILVLKPDFIGFEKQDLDHVDKDLVIMVNDIVREKTVDKMKTVSTKEIKINLEKSIKYIDTLPIGTKKFLDYLASRESTNLWDTSNIYGYIGKYQMGEAALSDVGRKITIKDFIKNPSIWPENEQDKDVVKWMKLNKRRLKSYIKIYDGTIIDSIKITESGILAAAHLAGAKGVKRYLDNNGLPDKKGITDTIDKNGTKLSDYMRDFANYEIDLK